MKTVKLGSYMVAEEVTDDDWLIRNKNRGEILGTVAWYKPWRKHVFQPEEGTEYSSDCLQAIGMFLESLKRGKVLAPDHGFNSERSKQSENGGRP